MKLVLMGMLLLSARIAQAFEAADIRGLPVTVEEIEERVMVDGLGLHITRAGGAGVAQLAQRIQERWRDEGSEVGLYPQQGWQIASRLHGDISEVIQWRDAGDAAQLLHSTLVVNQSPHRTAAAPFPLPSGCDWGRVIEGVAGPSRFEQRVARCQVSSVSVIGALRLRLLAQGWVLAGRAETGWELNRADIHGRLTVAGSPLASECSLVWIGVRHLQGAKR